MQELVSNRTRDTSSIGVRFRSAFDPIPFPLIALLLTMVGTTAAWYNFRSMANFTFLAGSLWPGMLEDGQRSADY